MEDLFILFSIVVGVYNFKVAFHHINTLSILNGFVSGVCFSQAFWLWII